jgi:hypothetical protein
VERAVHLSWGVLAAERLGVDFRLADDLELLDDIEADVRETGGTSECIREEHNDDSNSPRVIITEHTGAISRCADRHDRVFFPQRARPKAIQRHHDRWRWRSLFERRIARLGICVLCSLCPPIVGGLCHLRHGLGPLVFSRRPIYFRVA